MFYPQDQWYQDPDGYKWFWDAENNGYTLFAHEEQVCYVGLAFSLIEKTYGQLKAISCPQFLLGD